MLSAIGPRGRSRGVGWSIPGRRGEERDRARGLSRWLLSLPGEIKAWLDGLRTRVDPDVILTHRRDDAHRDHREICQLTWNLFRTISFSSTRSPNGTAI